MTLMETTITLSTMILVNALTTQPVEEQQLELVERKGRGHPDTIMDSVVDSISVALNREYLKRWGKILHYNLDKGFLAAGNSRPHFGGGKVQRPMLMMFGDRATVRVGGESINLDSLIEKVTRNWVKRNLRYVDPRKHLRIQNKIGRSAENLADIFARGGDFLGANDTSAAVGYAPNTKTETLVKTVEQHVNSPDFKRRFPDTGEDVKVMGRRVKDDLELTISIAFVDRFIDSESDYFRTKEEVRSAIEEFARERFTFSSLKVLVNNLDEPERGVDGLYLTVTGTSAESGDSGQVGRGNKANGIFSLCRPSSSEAASGKNPVSHVGKIYNAMSFQVAETIIERVESVREAYFWMLSKIGEPVNLPNIAAAQVIPRVSSDPEATMKQVRSVVEDCLTAEAFRELMGKLTRGELSLC